MPTSYYRQTFSINTNNTKYSYYRLIITQLIASQTLVIGDVSYFGKEELYATFEYVNTKTALFNNALTYTNGLTTLQGDLDCVGGISITGANAFILLVLSMLVI